uniref:Enolase C-terminal domain-containing protein n=1 Tax=Arcella intermedia TaxID=1963864 RepID=A0A6B2LKD8_9EUKA
MALTVPYSIKLINAIEPYNITWFEEFLPPDDYEGYAEVRKVTNRNILLTTGEHEYTRYGFRQLISKGCADILQPDVNWVGGVTEVRRIIAMAAAYDIPVIPHGSSVFSYHVQTAFANCPMGEFLNMSPGADKIVPVFGNLFKDEPLPKDGYIELSEKPGWGVELNKEQLNLSRPYPRKANSKL